MGGEGFQQRTFGVRQRVAGVEEQIDLADQVLLFSAGGATITTPAAAPAQVAYSLTSFGSGDVMNLTNGSLVETAAGTSPYEWYVMYKAGRNAAL